jgi:hypothetical protein
MNAACGTDAGYQRHRYLGESVDVACRRAHARNAREWRQRRRGVPLLKAQKIIDVKSPWWWHSLAACHNSQRVFISPHGGGDVAECVQICKECPVRTICLWYTLSVEAPGARYHVYGGLTVKQRDQLGISTETAQAAYQQESDRLYQQLVA